MKKRIFVILAWVALACSALAQMPQGFTYQAVVRDSDGKPVSFRFVSLRVSILQSSDHGTCLYTETQQVRTNGTGLFSVVLGNQGSGLNGIDWTHGTYYLKCEVDINGDGVYGVTSTQQLLSVPYALEAPVADSVRLLQFHETDPFFSRWDKDYNDLSNLPTIPTIPTNVSAFVNDTGYLTSVTETDPNVSGWAKQADKPTYNYSELLNVLTGISAFVNDSGYITSVTENDPTVPAWAKAPTKPTYNYSELSDTPTLFSGDYNDLSNKPTLPNIPTQVSTFANDAGYLTAYTETDPGVAAWAKASEKPSYDYSEITNKPAPFSGNYNDLTNKPSIPTVPTHVSAFVNDAGYLNSVTESDPTVPEWAKEPNKPAYDYGELSNTPTMPTVPTEVSAFANDAGYITGITESDPSVASWAKQASKPTYDYSEITNKPVLFSGDYNDLSNKPTLPGVPTNVSAFTNDAGYITYANRPETDPSVPDWAKATNKPSYDYGELGNTPTMPTVPSNVSAFANDAGYITGVTESDPSIADWAKQSSKPNYDYSELTGVPTAFSGDYNDLSDKPAIPSIPSQISTFNNDAGYITSAEMTVLVDNALTTAVSNAVNELQGEYRPVIDSLAGVTIRYTTSIDSLHCVLDSLKALHTAAPTHTVPEGAIDATFSVSATQQVYFSMGNLRYMGSAATPYWKFADSQTSFIGYHQAYTYTNVDRDLFGWGCSGYNGQDPWMTSNNPNAYSAGGADIAGTQYDWGVCNPIQNGGNQAGLWRTPTASEWAYLLNSRVVNGGSGEGYCWAHVTIDGRKGIIIFPDDYSGAATGLTSIPESCVFLPMAGGRVGTAYNYSNSQGMYWSSTMKNGIYAYSVSFTNSEMNSQNNTNNRMNGLCVRLIQNKE